MSSIFVLEQATVAAKQSNWTLLNQYLQQLLAKESDTAGLAVSDWSETTKSQLLHWALAVLQLGDFQERWDVAKVFPSLGLAAVPPLLDILADETADLELRWFTGRVLGQFPAPQVIQGLVELLQQAESEELSTMAAEALAQMGTLAIEPLTQLLAFENTRFLAVQALAQIRHSQTINPLLSVIKDQQPVVRTAVIEALSSFHDPRVPPVLVEALSDVAASVRREAIVGLGLRPDLQQTLKTVQLLRDRLWDFNWEVCQQAAISLGRMGTLEAAAALFEVLNSSLTPIPLQITAVRALGWIELPQTLDYLQQLLFSTATIEVAQEIVSALGRMEQPALAFPAAEILIKWLSSSDLLVQQPGLKSSIVLSLGQLGNPHALEPLIEMLADADECVRFHAIAALRQLAPHKAQWRLQVLATDEQLLPALKAGVNQALLEWSC
jgi:HEAT repeat protein